VEIDPKILSVAKIVPDLFRQVLQGNPDFPYLLTSQQADDMLHAGAIDDRHHWFGTGAGERAQAGAFPASHDDRFHCHPSPHKN
jgi:hypothetical protein